MDMALKYPTVDDLAKIVKIKGKNSPVRAEVV